MEITKREIIASITIIAVWFCIGFLIADKIDSWQQDRNAEYDRAARIEREDLFAHGMDTNLGNAFVYGDLQAMDPVTYPEIDGVYSYVRKVKEKYTMHTRIVTKTRRNASGKTETYPEVETYWTWDYAGEENQKSKNFIFLGQQFLANKFILPEGDHIETIKESSNVRYKYYGAPEKMTGTLYTTLQQGTIRDESKFYNNKTIMETTEMLTTEGLTNIFWIAWIIFGIFLIIGFYHLDNYWLNL